MGVLVTPYRSAWIGGVDGPGHAGVIRGGKLLDEFPGGKAEQSVSGTYLYGGPLKVHFGHVIVDTIPRLYAFDRRRHKGVIFPLLLEGKPIPGWLYDIFALFGVTEDDVHIVRVPTEFERVDFAEPGTDLRKPPPQWYLDYLASLSFRRHNTPPNVYLGRTHILNRGAMMGESYFGELLNHFEYVRPEEHDIHYQLSLFTNARRIVFAEGSAAYVACLLPKFDATMFMLPRRAGGVGLFAQQLSARGGFRVLGDRNLVRLANRNGRERPDSPSYTLNPASIHADMTRHGLIEEPFDLERFLEAERRDATQYGVPEQLDEIRRLRRSASA